MERMRENSTPGWNIQTEDEREQHSWLEYTDRG